MKKNRIIKLVLLAGMTLVGITVTNEAAGAAMLYRAYNPNTGEHLYTSNHNEIPFVVNAGWKDEGLSLGKFHQPEHRFIVCSIQITVVIITTHLIKKKWKC